MTITIELNHRKPRDETRQIAYVTVSGVDAQIYRFQVADVPIEFETDAQVLTHLEARKDKLHIFCLRKTYPGADPWDFRDPEKSELQNFQDWIDAGHKNKILIRYEDGEPIYDYIVIENHIYAGTHPLRYPPSEEDLDIALGLINEFGSKDYDQLEEEINNDITSVPKVREYLKEISKAFLALIKYVDFKT